ncbi:hypothetical protein AZH53_09320 [Methanomicrobiaceae archaeon CYW5]|uniref:Yip1 family protein n=1 Tax=Methanovulcanius yangii TaxID=1789227 RepID=UPI0029CA29F8|nr:Yip1 family protein [Methanovulcanius yangii]MBT8508603.1 hypothetical protein [Methanovulcanius yangii]
MEISYIDKIKGFLLDPVATLVAHRGEALEDAFKYLVVLLVIFAVLQALFTSVFIGAMAFPGMTVAVFALLGIVFGIVGGLLGFVIGGVILHLFVLIVGGRMGLSATLKAVIYAATPGLLFGWIPFVGFIASLWALVLEVLAIRELHEISTARAVFAVVIPFALVVILAILAIGFFTIASVTSGPVMGPY